MKNTIIYVAAFLLSFLLTSGAVIYLNSYYADIFNFNFTTLVKDKPQNSAEKISTLDGALLREMKIAINEMKSDLLDSLGSVSKPIAVASQSNRVASDSLTIDSLHKYIAKIIKEEKKEPPQPVVKKKEVVESAPLIKSITEVKPPERQDSSYSSWKKQTAALYEMMEAKKAAKIIQNFSDNVARDILYTMKKKKAAEILAELNPETANRITRAQ